MFLCVGLPLILCENGHTRVSSNSLLAHPITNCETPLYPQQTKFLRTHTVATLDVLPKNGIRITGDVPALGNDLSLSWHHFIAWCLNVREWTRECSDLLFVGVPWALFVHFVLLPV